jgi:hypothetical protein
MDNPIFHDLPLEQFRAVYQLEQDLEACRGEVSRKIGHVNDAELESEDYMRISRLLSEKLHVKNEHLIPANASILVANGIRNWTDLTDLEKIGTEHTRYKWGLNVAISKRIYAYAMLLADGSLNESNSYDYMTCYNATRALMPHEVGRPRKVAFSDGTHPKDW